MASINAVYLTLSEYVFIKRTLEDVLECNGDDQLLDDVIESVEESLSILSNTNIVDEQIADELPPDFPPWEED